MVRLGIVLLLSGLLRPPRLEFEPLLLSFDLLLDEPEGVLRFLHVFVLKGLNEVTNARSEVLNPSLLSEQLAGWEHSVRPGSFSAQYLQRAAIPFAGVLARVVPVGQITAGLAMIAGFWTPLFAFIALVMIVNFYVASGAIFTFGFLTNPYGLPVLGGTLALAIGGVRLPLGLRS